MGPNREPEHSEGQSYREILWPVLIAWIAAIFLVTRFAEQLEQSKSSNTLVLMGALATTLIAPVIGALAIIIRRLNEVGHALNGAFQPRVAEAVEPQLQALAAQNDDLSRQMTISNRQIAKVVARLDKGDGVFDELRQSLEALRTQQAATNARLETLTNCDIKPPEG